MIKISWLPDFFSFSGFGSGFGFRRNPNRYAALTLQRTASSLSLSLSLSLYESLRYSSAPERLEISSRSPDPRARSLHCQVEIVFVVQVFERINRVFPRWITFSRCFSSLSALIFIYLFIFAEFFYVYVSIWIYMVKFWGWLTFRWIWLVLRVGNFGEAREHVVPDELGFGNVFSRQCMRRLEVFEEVEIISFLIYILIG